MLTDTTKRNINFAGLEEQGKETNKLGDYAIATQTLGD